MSESNNPFTKLTEVSDSSSVSETKQPKSTPTKKKATQKRKKNPSAPQSSKETTVTSSSTKEEVMAQQVAFSSLLALLFQKLTIFDFSINVFRYV
jgi:plasmid rolling circle replication initiator protein Rep